MQKNIFYYWKNLKIPKVPSCAAWDTHLCQNLFDLFSDGADRRLDCDHSLIEALLIRGYHLLILSYLFKVGDNAMIFLE